ncbi:MAG: LacI family DNA-binding transcriptional regulator [Erysipelotrichaceae bacterium]|nr:LacI family DNA-binding transcriptional regulator [Erysipelotrichaceae bacterium]
MISIKEIAKLSGVSITTVSKIINNKADDISQETKEKVLAIVKKYNYTPYGIPRNSAKTKSFTIGLLLKKMYNTNLIITGLVETLNKHGYTLMLFDSEESLERELQNLSKISHQNLDGLIWEPISSESLENIDILKNCNTKIMYIDPSKQLPNSYYIDYSKLGYHAAQTLIDLGHTKIGCYLKRKSLRSEMVLHGFKQCLFEHSILLSPDMVIYSDRFIPNDIKAKGITALISSHFALTQELHSQLEKINASIPEELSLLSLRDDVREGLNIFNVSTIKIPNYEFGMFIGDKIISLCESKDSDNTEEFELIPMIESNRSLDIPYYLRKPKITVVGSINIDNILYLEQFPTPGNTQFASECVILPGGKGLNQAIGVSMLKKDVTLIGKVGKDNEGGLVFKTLSDHSIDTHCIIANSTVKTGKAFIVINRDGESIIAVTEGANSSLSPIDIRDLSKEFDNTGICLLQTEVPIEVVKEAAKIAKQNKAITILKPATIEMMFDEDYQNIDIFVPNRKEAIRLSGKQTIEEAAEYFLTKGIDTVIITLDEDGAYLCTKESKSYYNAPQVDVIDTTGGSDAFISTLAVMLLENNSMDVAIKAATIAAGFCISKFGVSNSMIDQKTLERFLVQRKIK